MSTVLINIAALTMAIFLSIGGIMYFGPNFRAGNERGQAQVMAQVLSLVATGVQVRERESQDVTPATFDLSSLVPEYIPDVPAHPFGGPDPILVDKNGTQSGSAAFALLKVEGSASEAVCKNINVFGGGGDGVAARVAPDPGQSLGCYKAEVAVGDAIPAGSFVAYAALY